MADEVFAEHAWLEKQDLHIVDGLYILCISFREGRCKCTAPYNRDSPGPVFERQGQGQAIKGPSSLTIQKTQEGQRYMRTLAMLLFAGLIPHQAQAQELATRMIVDFAEPETARWTIVNDGVMGGRSSSDVELTEENTALFSGILSLENNGGFASVRGRFPTLDLSAYEGVTLRVRGDGRTYQLRFRMNGSFNGVAHGTEFETKAGEWTEVSIPFSRFQPTFMGYRPRGAGPLDPSRIQQITFLVGDKIEAPFQLEIAWVKAHATSAETDAPGN